MVEIREFSAVDDYAQLGLIARHARPAVRPLFFYVSIYINGLSIPRYLLLLRDIQKYSDPQSNDHRLLGLAIAKIDAELGTSSPPSLRNII